MISNAEKVRTVSKKGLTNEKKKNKNKKTHNSPGRLLASEKGANSYLPLSY